MNTHKSLLLSVTLLFSLAACNRITDPTLMPPKETKTSPSLVNTLMPNDLKNSSKNTSEVVQAVLGQPFELQIGQPAMVEGLIITFLSISEDSRCPEGANCIWAGRAKVVLRVEKGGKFLGEYELTHGSTTQRDVEGVAIDDLLLRLLAVEPYPSVETQIEVQDYVMTLVLGE